MQCRCTDQATCSSWQVRSSRPNKLQPLAADIFNLAAQRFGTRKHWHQRLVRVGANTVKVYSDNEDVPNLTLAQVHRPHHASLLGCSVRHMATPDH